MKIDLRGKTVLITGASRGIGRATAVKFAQCGARIIIHFRNNGTEALKTLSLLPEGKHFLVRNDFSDTASVEHFFAKILKKTDRIDIFINNAGIYKECNLLKATFSDWQKHFDETMKVNFASPFLLTYFVARHMAEKGGGKIINVTSRGAFRGEPLAPAYGASKAALNQFSQSMAYLLAPKNIFVYAVAPGFVDTEMSKKALSGEKGLEIKKQSPLNRVATADEVAQAILLLAADNTEFMTGAIIDVNGASYFRT